MNEVLVNILVSLGYVVLILLGYYVSIRNKVKNEALNAINNAESQNDKSGEEKMQLAIESVYSAIPVVAKPFISKDFIRIAIQAAFDQVEAFAEKQK